MPCFAAAARPRTACRGAPRLQSKPSHPCMWPSRCFFVLPLRSRAAAAATAAVVVVVAVCLNRRAGPGLFSVIADWRERGGSRGTGLAGLPGYSLAVRRPGLQDAAAAARAPSASWTRTPPPDSAPPDSAPPPGQEPPATLAPSAQDGPSAADDASSGVRQREDEKFSEVCVCARV